VAFTDFRCVVHRRDIDGEGLGRRGHTVFTTVGYLNSDIGGPGISAVFTRRPADCTGGSDAHACRRSGQRKCQVGAVVGIVRIIHDDLVAVRLAFGGGSRCGGGNYRRIVHITHRDGPALCCRAGTVFATVTDLHGDVGAGDTIRWRPADHARRADGHAGRRRGERERQVGAVVGVIAVADGNGVLIERTFYGTERCRRGNGRCIVHRRDGNAERLRRRVGAIADFDSNVFI